MLGVVSFSRFVMICVFCILYLLVGFDGDLLDVWLYCINSVGC